MMEDLKALIKKKKQRYGNNFPCIAKKWSEYLSTSIEPQEVALMMALMKKCRCEVEGYDGDSELDLRAYTWIAHNYKEYEKL